MRGKRLQEGEIRAATNLDPHLHPTVDFGSVKPELLQGIIMVLIFI